MYDFRKHLIQTNIKVRQVLEKLDSLAADAILFLVDEDSKLIGSLTDGDIRRGLIKGKILDENITSFVQSNPKYLKKSDYNIKQLKEWRANNFKIIPIVDEENRVIDVINLRLQKSFLPLDAVIMAGGKGTRLRPLTLDTPKPLLKIGDKPIIEYNTDRLALFGIKNITLTLNYLGEQLVKYYGDGRSKNLNIQYVKETEPLGTIGSLSLIDKFYNNYILVMNSDLLTNIDYEDMFAQLKDQDADMIVASIPYKVEIPYGVIETDGDRIVNLKEKPTYTYYSNAGIYIIKKEHISLIPKNEHFNATDLMEALYSTGKKVLNFPILSYWLDIGKHTDFDKAQQDVDYINFK